MTNITKQCIECGKELPINEFHKCKRLKDGHKNRCKSCRNRHRKEHYKKNKDRIVEQCAKYRFENKEKVKSFKRKYYIENIDKLEKKRKEYYEINKDKELNRNKKYYKLNKSKYKELHLKRKFNLSLLNYIQILADQKNRCSICNKHRDELYRDLVVDHNHSTKIIRGLLCDNCNLGIGLFKEDIFILNRAINYIIKNDFTPLNDNKLNY